MPSIQVSDLVYAAIADQRRPGQTDDDYLRRVLGLPSRAEANGSGPTAYLGTGSPRRGRASFATHRLSSYISADQLHLSFQGGPSRSWPLPPRTDKVALKRIRDQAVTFARDHGATMGQVNAVKKTLTDAGYHLTR